MAARFDAVVAGGGPAGAAAAIALARAGRRVLLAEARPEAFKVGESLPPGVRPLLRDLGVLDRFERAGHLPSHGTAAAWGASEPGGFDFVFDPNGHGWHVDRVRFDGLLREAAREAGAEVREGVALRDLGRDPEGGWTARLDPAGPAVRDGAGSTVRSHAVVDATGRRPAVARRLGARRHRLDRLVAVYAVVRAAADDADARTLVEAVPEGWWYTALVPEGRRVVAFLGDSDSMPAELRTARGFAAALDETEHMRARAGGLEAEVGPRVAPAHGAALAPPAGEDWIAVGDAAIALDPLSSQGILTALYTGLAGGRALDAALGGDHEGMREHVRRVAAIGAAYEGARARFYALEERWPDEPFWARRAVRERPRERLA